MKVKSLRLQNFRLHEDSVLAFGDNSFIVIRGRNFAGKSSIGQGLSMCLTPTTSGLDPQGRGFISKIKRGASKAVITADFQTKHHVIQRTVTLNTNASGRTQKTVCLSDPEWRPTRFDDELEKQRAALTVVLNTDAFFRMDEKEQKNLLASLALPSRYDFDPSVVAEVQAILGEKTVNFEGEPFAAINQAYKKLFDERQIVNRQVKEFSIPEEMPIPLGVDSLSLQDQLTAMRAKRNAAQQERDQAVAEATKKEQARFRAKEKIDQAVESEQRRKRSIVERLLKEGQLAYLRKLVGGKEELEKLEAERKQAVILREANATQLKGIEGMPWGAKNCPTCDQPVDAEKIKTLQAKLAGWVHNVDVSLAMIDQKINALGDIKGSLALIEGHNQALKELEEFETASEERLRKIEETRKDVPDATMFDFAPFNESIGGCDAEIERLSNLLRPVIVAEERAKEIEIKQGQFAALKEKAATLDRLVKYFDKGGIKAKLLGEYIGSFEYKLNDVMSAWGYSCALSIEPYSFDVTTARGDVIPVRELSGAERVMFSLAFQCAVSRTANIGIVVIDEVATFLPEIRSAMNKRLYEMIRDGSLEQAILLVADTSEQISKLPGMAFFMVDSGTVHPLVQNSVVRKEPVNERNAERSIVA